MNVPTVRRFYPATVMLWENGFSFDWATPYFYGHSFDTVPKPSGEFHGYKGNCTVEVLEYPDGRYSAAWFPGEFRSETSPDAQNCP